MGGGGHVHSKGWCLGDLGGDLRLVPNGMRFGKEASKFIC